MSRRIAQLLDEPEYLVNKWINQLEAKNGYPSHDARLIAENIQRVRTKIIDLGLDPDDTTGRELYHALLTKFEQDSYQLDRFYRMDGAGFDEKAAKAISLIQADITMPDRWSIKSAALKSLLKQQPPKRVMKQLGYRSADSLLKRENPAEILMMAQSLESTTWHNNFERLVSNLSQADVQMRKLNIKVLEFKKWSRLEAPDDFVIADEHTATVGLYPFRGLVKAPLLNIVMLLLDGLGSLSMINTKKQPDQIGNILNWWLDMDYLMAELDEEPVSLSLKDTALNWLMKNTYELRSLDHAKKSFWAELTNRYENLPSVDGLFDGSAKEKVSKLKLAIPEPVLEFAEEFDG